MIPAQKLRNTAFWLGIALPSAALIATVWVTQATNRQFNQAFAAVTHTYKILTLLEDAQAHIADAETGQRGYLVTGREDYFTLYGTAIAAVNSDIQQLRILVEENKTQLAHLDRLQEVVHTRLESVATIHDVPADRMPVALTDQGLETIRQFRGLLFRMRQEATDALAQRQQHAEEQFLFGQNISFALAAIIAISLVAIIAAVKRLEHLRQIVTVCAWTGQVKDGSDWIRLEDYLKKRFGVAVSHGLSREAADKMTSEMRQSKITDPVA
ncbi:MAG TPA: CHASE3 domain-containing protein [Desulfuromonadaceae bacterium]|nr:CHASE3 domain-containing protein [Desulfuromonadaceae bacterium]